MTEEVVIISKKEYDNLLDSKRFLMALENAGVDNWSGYDFAVELYGEEEDV